MWHTFLNLWHLRQSWYWDWTQCRASQLRLIRMLLQKAAKTVPYYREIFADTSIPDRDTLDFVAYAKLPLLTKSDIKRNYPDRLVCEDVNRQKLYPVATSGTTDRIMTFQDESKRDWDRAADLLCRWRDKGIRWLRREVVIPPDACYERCGADEQGRTATVISKFREMLKARKGERKSAFRKVLTQFFQDYIWRVTIMKNFGIDGTNTSPEIVDDYIQRLQKLKPHMLSALPQYLHILAQYLASDAQTCSIPIIRPSGGKITECMVKSIEKQFPSRVRENYGTAELGTIAFDCPHNRRQHLLSELFYLELLRHGRAVAPGELGEIVITDLRNHVAPFIRYVTGDVGRFQIETCACGYTGITFTVDSRLDETIVTPTGQAYSGAEIVDFFLQCPKIKYVKIVQQRDDQFLLDVVPANPQSALPDPHHLSQAFSHQLGYPVTLRMRKVKRIAPERNGKYILVTSTSYQRFQEEKPHASKTG